MTAARQRSVLLLTLLLMHSLCLSQTISIQEPDENSEWGIASTQTINWSTTDIPADAVVTIELARNLDSEFSTIVSGLGNDGSERWVVTRPEANAARIRITVTVGDSTTYEAISSPFSIVNNPPALKRPLADMMIIRNRLFVLNLDDYFFDPNGDALIYSATGGGVVNAGVQDRGDTLFFSAVRNGVGDVLVTAADPGGRIVEEIFNVTVRENRAPSVIAFVPDTTVLTDGSDLKIAPQLLFQDPDGDSLSYSARIFGIFTIKPGGDTLRVDPDTLAGLGFSGRAGVVTITAKDDFDSTQASFSLYVNTRPQILSQAFPDTTIPVTVGRDTFVIDLDLAFLDPDGDTLKFIPELNNKALGSAGILTTEDGNLLSFVPRQSGEATLTIEANDGHLGVAEDSIRFCINSPPMMVASFFPDRSSQNQRDTLIIGLDPLLQRDLDEIYNDESELSFFALSSQSSVATASVDSGSLLVISPSSEGVTQVTIRATDAQNVTTEDMIEILVADLPEIMVRSDTTRVAPAEEPFRVSAEITDNSGISEAILHFRIGGEKDTLSVSMEREVNTEIFTASVLKFLVSSQGFEYSIQARDSLGFRNSNPTTGFRSASISERNVTSALAITSGSAQEAYRLISFPLDFDGARQASYLEAIFGRYDVEKWRFFGLLDDYLSIPPDQSIYADFDHLESVESGRAYWILFNEGGSRNLSVEEGRSFSLSEPRTVGLQQGWNLIGNPFNFEIPLSNLTTPTSGALFERARKYEGRWVTQGPDSIIRPFEGFALFHDGTVQDSILYIWPDTPQNDLMPAPPNSTGKSGQPGEWQIRILASCQQASEGDNILGVKRDALESWDHMDLVEPPVIGEYVSVYFPHPEWQRVLNRYCSDFRSTGSDGYVWDFEVRTNIAGDVVLRFAGLDALPGSLNILLLDKATGVSQDLRDHEVHTVPKRGTPEPAALAVIVGSSEFIQRQSDMLKLIPTRFELAQNYPNPFNPATTIRYALPEPARVNLAVYNVRGELVANLVSDAHLDAGYHTMHWDGRDRFGIQVGSGIYLYHLQTDVFSAVKKMLLVR